MKRYKIELTLNSPTLIGSGEGSGTFIDSDIVFDELGFPYIPSKRLKGCLRDSAIEICEMFQMAGILSFINLTSDNTENKFKLVTSVFGSKGQKEPASVFFSNLTLKDYDEKNKAWLRYLYIKFGQIINREAIISTFTEIRQQTAIDKDKGIAKEHSLRTIRVAKKGLVFTGTIDVDFHDITEIEKLLFLACNNLRRFGTKRNRGFGEIGCRLFEDSKRTQKGT